MVIRQPDCQLIHDSRIHLPPFIPWPASSETFTDGVSVGLLPRRPPQSVFSVEGIHPRDGDLSQILVL